MSYTNNWAKELKESYIEEKKARQVVNEEYRRPKPQGKPVPVKPATGMVGKMAKRIAKRGRAALAALGTRGGPDAAMHLGKGGVYDHVEHEGNSLQEEVALNEHLLMLIDILCEELGIDVEDLLSEDFTTAAREHELTQGVLSAVSRGDHSRASELVDRLDNESADSKKVYGKGGKELKKAAGFHRVPGARKSSSRVPGARKSSSSKKSK